MVTSFQRPLKSLKAPRDTKKNFIEFRQLQLDEKARLSAGRAVSQSMPRTALPATLHAFNIHDSDAVKPNSRVSAAYDSVSISASSKRKHSHRNSIALSVLAAIVVGAVVGTSWQSDRQSGSQSVISDTRASQSAVSEKASSEEPLQASVSGLPATSPPVADTPPVLATQPAATSLSAADVPPAVIDANQAENDLNSTEELARQYRQELTRLHARNATLNSKVNAGGKEATDLNNELMQLTQDLAARKSAAQPKVVTRTVYNFVNGAAGNNVGNSRSAPSRSSETNWESGEEIVDEDYEQIPVEWDSNGQPIVFVDAFSDD